MSRTSIVGNFSKIHQTDIKKKINRVAIVAGNGKDNQKARQARRGADHFKGSKTIHFHVNHGKNFVLFCQKSMKTTSPAGRRRDVASNKQNDKQTVRTEQKGT